VAVVEINNENTLFDLDMDSLPASYRQDVQAKWNAWLRPTTLRSGIIPAKHSPGWGDAVPASRYRVGRRRPGEPL
jgi:hypothetical protein